MFDLEKSIAEWRRQVLAAGVKASEAMDELEGHLRDDVDAQIRSGITAERAFENAVQRIGQPVALRKEFAKVTRRKWGLLQKLKVAVFGPHKFPVPAFENFTQEARHMLELAPEEARRFHHDFVGTEHVLLGLAQSQSAIVSNVMRRLGLSSDAIRREIEKMVFFGVAQEGVADIPLTPRARKALRLAADEARALNHSHVSAEHIFLGLIREGGGVAAMALKNLGVGIEMAREEMLREMRATQQD